MEKRNLLYEFKDLVGLFEDPKSMEEFMREALEYYIQESQDDGHKLATKYYFINNLINLLKDVVEDPAAMIVPGVSERSQDKTGTPDPAALKSAVTKELSKKLIAGEFYPKSVIDDKDATIKKLSQTIGSLEAKIEKLTK